LSPHKKACVCACVCAHTDLHVQHKQLTDLKKLLKDKSDKAVIQILKSYTRMCENVLIRLFASAFVCNCEYLIENSITGFKEKFLTDLSDLIKEIENSEGF